MRMQLTPQPAADPKAASDGNADGPAQGLSASPAAPAEVSAPATGGEADGDMEWVGSAADIEIDDEDTLEEEEVRSNAND